MFDLNEIPIRFKSGMQHNQPLHLNPDEHLPTNQLKLCLSPLYGLDCGFKVIMFNQF